MAFFALAPRRGHGHWQRSRLAVLVLVSVASCGRTRLTDGMLDGEVGGGGGEAARPGAIAGGPASVAGSSASAGRPSVEGGAPNGGSGAEAGTAGATEEGGVAGDGANTAGEGGAGGEGAGVGGAGGASDGGESGAGGAGGAMEPTEPCVLRVKPTGSDLSDGSSWPAAFATLEGAMQAWSKRADVEHVCQVWVAEGTYAPVPWSRESYPTLRVPDGTEIYGGFLGTEETLAGRNGSSNLTIVTGIRVGTTERLRPVLTTGGSVRLDQLTIRDGQSTGQGGGVVCESGDLLLNEVRVTQNAAADGGGLLVTSACSAQVQASTFNLNVAGDNQSVEGGRGGGIANLGGRLVVRGGSFATNISSVRGGGVYTTGNTEIADAQFTTNYVSSLVGPVAGGALYADGSAGAETRLRGCTVRANVLRGGLGYGAGLAGSALVVASSALSQNTKVTMGDLYGGAIYATGSLTVEDSTITRNAPRGGSTGGGIYFEQGELRVRRTPFDANGGAAGAQLRCAVGCRGQVSASFSGAAANGVATAVLFDGASLDLVNSVFSGGIYPHLRVDAPNGAARVIHSTFATTFEPDRATIEHVAGSLALESSVMSTFVAPELNVVPTQILSTALGALTVDKSDIVGLCGGASSCGSNWDVLPVYGAAVPYPASNSFVIDAGGAPLPADFLDLDDDGNVTESLPVDFDGNPRVRGARSDLGAIEYVP